MISKRIVLFSSLLVTATLFAVNYVGNVRLCTFRGVFSYSCLDIAFSIGVALFLHVALVFLLTLLTYFMREQVYNTWFRFARWWVPPAIFLILITPEYGLGGGGFGPSLSIGKGDVSLLLSVVFLIVSLIIIVIALIKSRKKAS
jgi:hypothetical protein